MACSFSDSLTRGLSGSSVHGVLQARIPEWVTISSSRGSSQARYWTLVFCFGRQILYHCITREAPIAWGWWESPLKLCWGTENDLGKVVRTMFFTELTPSTKRAGDSLKSSSYVPGVSPLPKPVRVGDPREGVLFFVWQTQSWHRGAGSHRQESLMKWTPLQIRGRSINSGWRWRHSWRWTCVVWCMCVLSRSVVSDSLRPMDCSLSGSSLQARILERSAISFSGGSSEPRDRTHVSHISCTGRRFFITRATWEGTYQGCHQSSQRKLAGCQTQHTALPLTGVSSLTDKRKLRLRGVNWDSCVCSKPGGKGRTRSWTVRPQKPWSQPRAYTAAFRTLSSPFPRPGGWNQWHEQGILSWAPSPGAPFPS